MEGFNNDEQYIDQKSQSSYQKLGSTNIERAQNSREADKSLMLPYVDVEYKNEGSFHQSFEKKINNQTYKTDISFSYNSDCSIPKITLGENNSLFDLNRLRRLTTLKIESEHYILDSSLIPFPKLGIYFFDTNELSDTEKLRYLYQGSEGLFSGIISGFPPNTPAGILTILHELGHFWRSDADNLKTRLGGLDRSYTKLKEGQIMSNHERASVLEEERSAWAISLKEVIEFLTPVCEPEDIKKHMHFALSTYGKALEGTKTS